MDKQISEKKISTKIIGSKTQEKAKSNQKTKKDSSSELSAPYACKLIFFKLTYNQALRNSYHKDKGKKTLLVNSIFTQQVFEMWFNNIETVEKFFQYTKTYVHIPVQCKQVAVIRLILNILHNIGTTIIMSRRGQ